MKTAIKPSDRYTFKNSGRSPAYIQAACIALNAGATVLAAHRVALLATEKVSPKRIKLWEAQAIALIGARNSLRMRHAHHAARVADNSYIKRLENSLGF